MPFLEWSDELSVGNPVLDTQHRRLVDLLNEFHDAIQEGKAQSSLQHVFASLLEYTEVHFRTEEKLFQFSDYPLKDEHIKEHERLMEEASALRERFADGSRYITLETLNFLKEWVSHHIQKTDMGYKDFI